MFNIFIKESINYINYLLEDRIEFLQNKYNIEDDTINTLSKIDPTQSNKYLEWLIKIYKNNKLNLEDKNKLEQITKCLELFSAQKFQNQLNNEYKDINNFKSASDFIEFIKPYEILNFNSKNKERINGLAFETDKWLVYIPKTYEENEAIAKGASWCTVGSKNGKNNFKEYTKYGYLYIFINKKNPKEKYQLSVIKDEFTDINNSAIDDFDSHLDSQGPLSDSEVINKLKDYVLLDVTNMYNKITKKLIDKMSDLDKLNHLRHIDPIYFQDNFILKDIFPDINKTMTKMLENKKINKSAILNELALLVNNITHIDKILIGGLEYDDHGEELYDNSLIKTLSSKMDILFKNLISAKQLEIEDITIKDLAPKANIDYLILNECFVNKISCKNINQLDLIRIFPQEDNNTAITINIEQIDMVEITLRPYSNTLKSIKGIKKIKTLVFLEEIKEDSISFPDIEYIDKVIFKRKMNVFMKMYFEGLRLNKKIGQLIER